MHPKRPKPATVCSFSKALVSEHSVFFHKGSHVVILNAASMLDEVVAREQIFRIIVPYSFQRTILSVFYFYTVHNRHRNLDICKVEVVPHHDKIRIPVCLFALSEGLANYQKRESCSGSGICGQPCPYTIFRKEGGEVTASSSNPFSAKDTNIAAERA